MDANKLEERFAFYARHEKQLEEWFRLRKDFREEASRFYSRLDLIRRDAGLSRVTVKFDNAGYYRRLRFFKDEWNTDGRGDKPSIGLEWNQDSTFTDGHLTFGIRCEAKMPPSQADFEEALKKHGRTDYELSKDSSPWRVYLRRNRIPPPDAEYWKDLSKHRDDLVNFVQKHWLVLSEVVDEALRLTDSAT